MQRNEQHKSAYQPDPTIIACHDAIIACLKERRAVVWSRVNTLIKGATRSLREGIARLRSIPGIGPIVAITLVAETDGFALFDNKRQVASYAGLDVRQSQSGKHAGRSRISKRGNWRVRKALYMAALSAARYNEVLKEWYVGIKQRTQTPKVAIVGVMRKLLTLAFTLWKNETDFDPKFEQKRRQSIERERTRTKEATCEQVAISFAS